MPEGFETDIERTAGATDGFAIHRFPDYLAGVPSGVCVMRRSPSIASALPDDVDVYLVLDDFGKSGRSWREIDEEQTDRETIITDLMRGEFNSPVPGGCFQHCRRLVARCLRRYRRRDPEAI